MSHFWLIRSLIVVGLPVSVMGIGLIGAACYFLHVFSRPHHPLNETFEWGLPATTAEPPLSRQRTLYLRTKDGLRLCADFWTQDQPAPTVILCHGYRISRQHLRPVAALQYARGYNILLFDFRGHGESDAAIISVGNAEVRDIEAAIAFASRQKETLAGQIILHGFSMGAHVSLLMPPSSEVAAIIADSPFARSDEVIHPIICTEILQFLKKCPRWLHPLHRLTPRLASAILATSRVLFRFRFHIPLIARADLNLQRQTYGTPLLLIHTLGDALIPATHSQMLAQIARANGIPVETCFMHGNTHCGAYACDSQRYDQITYRFLARYLGKHLPRQHGESA